MSSYNQEHFLSTPVATGLRAERELTEAAVRMSEDLAEQLYHFSPTGRKEMFRSERIDWLDP